MGQSWVSGKDSHRGPRGGGTSSAFGNLPSALGIPPLKAQLCLWTDKRLRGEAEVGPLAAHAPRLLLAVSL